MLLNSACWCESEIATHESYCKGYMQTRNDYEFFDTEKVSQDHLC
jgi:hypothetical protein